MKCKADACKTSKGLHCDPRRGCGDALLCCDGVVDARPTRVGVRCGCGCEHTAASACTGPAAAKRRAVRTAIILKKAARFFATCSNSGRSSACRAQHRRISAANRHSSDAESESRTRAFARTEEGGVVVRVDAKEFGFVLRHLRAEVVGADLDRAQLCLRLRHPRAVEQLPAIESRSIGSDQGRAEARRARKHVLEGRGRGEQLPEDHREGVHVRLGRHHLLQANTDASESLHLHAHTWRGAPPSSPRD